MTSTLDSTLAGERETSLEALIQLSRHYGANPRFVLAGGGNTSVKVGDRLHVKGSGQPLAGIGPDGFVEMDRTRLQYLLDSTLSSDRMRREEEFKQAVLAARVQPEKGQRPSVEAVLHHLIPGRFVVHTHATLVNVFACSQDGKQVVEAALGQDVVWIDAIDPGFLLAKRLEEALRAFSARTGKACPRAVIMQNHGLVVSGETPGEIEAHTDWLMSRLQSLLAAIGEGSSFGALGEHLADAEARSLIEIIGPALRGLLAPGDQGLKIVTFDDSVAVLSLVRGADGETVAEGGPLTPDQIVYCKSFPLWFQAIAGESTDQTLLRLTAAVEEYRQRRHSPPNVVLVRGLGLFAAGDAWADADTVRLVYGDVVTVMAGARRLGGVRYLRPDLREFIENWEVESYRRQIAASRAGAGRVAGKVALVTGAAQGFGLEIARDLAAQGAHVVLVDVNLVGAEDAAAVLRDQLGPGRALALAMNVAESASVAAAMHQTVRAYGGLDVLVSNAGVLRADGVRTQSERDFDLATAVNYKGYFLCVQKAAPVLSLQHRVRPGYWSDIIQINSKSGLVGSNRNFAYAGSKFGGIGLTQSFALELVTEGIKVNAVCPGNFLEGPLWSDPVNGLFVQYLRTGKVPGATSVDDVRAFYENKVPMGRGCTVQDVMKALYYLIEQQYETGQAVPVTGGQVMLH